jgi:hypothetical protein
MMTSTSLENPSIYRSGLEEGELAKGLKGSTCQREGKKAENCVYLSTLALPSPTSTQPPVPSFKIELLLRLCSASMRIKNQVIIMASGST